MAFAIIKTGGKQYKVSEGDILTVEKLPEEAKKGGKVAFGEVLLSDDGKETTMGTPAIAGAKVEAEVVGEGRADKVRVVHYKAKIRYHKVYGHRQAFTKVKIGKIA
ncbi:MAG: 50S ribosomal protein L21 [Candidatus Pacebacteria bacterium]|nr:50S ribosomal protein L21 [Candidatus Paceibacterota bacterium]